MKPKDDNPVRTAGSNPRRVAKNWGLYGRRAHMKTNKQLRNRAKHILVDDYDYDEDYDLDY